MMWVMFRTLATSMPSRRTAFFSSVLLLALAFPSVATFFRGASLSEASFGKSMVHALGGLSPTLIACLVAIMLCGRNSQFRKRLDVFLHAGLSATHRARIVTCTTFFVSVISGLSAALLVAVARLGFKVGNASILAHDVWGTFLSLFLGVFFWSMLAIALVAKTGLVSRTYLVVLIDLALRVIPGVGAWLSPSAHLHNMLGAPPASSFVRVPVIPQWASFATLLIMSVLAVLFAERRFRHTKIQ